MQKLQNSLIASLVTNFDDKMGGEELLGCTMKFCVDYIIDEDRGLEDRDWEEEEIRFVKDALLCKDSVEFLNGGLGGSGRCQHVQVSERIQDEVCLYW